MNSPEYFLICDLESTHKIISCAEIITASFIITDLEFNIVDERSFKMKPKYWAKEHDEAATIHKISREEAFRFPDKKEVLNDIFEFLSGRTYYFTGHFNRDNFGMKTSFDFALLKQEFFDLNADMYFAFGTMCRVQNICSTHSLAEQAFKECKIDVPLAIKDGNKKASRDFGLKNICRIMKVDLGNHHDSYVDALAAYNLLVEFSKIIDVFAVIENDWRVVDDR